MYMLVVGSGLSDELDTEGGLLRVRLIVVPRFMFWENCMAGVQGDSQRTICFKLVGSCGFPSHETASDALGKYGRLKSWR
jgi:hypothetical protein